MLLSIDEAKVAEQLQQTQRTYIVTPCNVKMETVQPAEPSGVSVISTVVAMPPDLEQARARLLALRQRLIDKGEKPLSTADLERHITDTRGR